MVQLTAVTFRGVEVVSLRWGKGMEKDYLIQYAPHWLLLREDTGKILRWKNELCRICRMRNMKSQRMNCSQPFLQLFCEKWYRPNTALRLALGLVEEWAIPGQVCGADMQLIW
jgi:hypothetical protein